MSQAGAKPAAAADGQSVGLSVVLNRVRRPDEVRLPHVVEFRKVSKTYNAGRPIFRGLFEDNDPAKRLRMFVCYNTDISQFWEWSGRGFRPIDETNEAYKLGVNAIIYGLTH